MEVYVRLFPNTTDFEEQVSVAGGVQPWWIRVGDELFYFSPEGGLSRIKHLTQQERRQTRWYH